MTTTLPKIKWRFAEQTMFTDKQARRLKDAICESCQVEAGEMAILENFTAFLSVTESVEFPVDKALASLKAMPAFLATWQDMSPSEVWEFRVKKISHPVWINWVNAFTRRDDLFEADESELPEDALTAEQRAQAADPTSPLA
jgi:hypothetical protein